MNFYERNKGTTMSREAIFRYHSILKYQERLFFVTFEGNEKMNAFRSNILQHSQSNIKIIFLIRDRLTT